MFIYQFVLSLVIICDICNIISLRYHKKVRKIGSLTEWYHKKYCLLHFSSIPVPHRLRDKVVPLRCVQLLCELFYLQMDCYAKPRDQPKTNQFEEELFLVEVIVVYVS